MGKIPERVAGRTVEDWIEVALNSVLENGMSLIEAYCAGLVAVYIGYTNQDGSGAIHETTDFMVSKNSGHIPMILTPKARSRA